jgi:hypothetical protein
MPILAQYAHHQNTNLSIFDINNFPEVGGLMFRYVNIGDCIHEDIYKKVKKTDKGCWIVPYHIDHTILDNYEKNKKFVLDKGSKRFAYESRKRAFNSFIVRKFRQIGILKHQLEVANEMYKQAEQIYKDTFK